MFKRNYFMSAKCTDRDGYCFRSTIVSYTSVFSDSIFVFDDMTKDFKKEMMKIRPYGNFQVVAFNRV